MTIIQSESFIFDPRPFIPLVTTVKRYWGPSTTLNDDNPTALTLIFAHGTGFHKEHWEPSIEDLYDIVEQQSNPASRLRIREVWSIDAPNHGDAAVLNEGVLQWSYEPIFRWDDYGRMIHAFLAGLGKGVNADFRGHNLVGIGHSMGAISMLLSLNYFPSLTFQSIILIEPMTMSQSNSVGPSNFLAEGAAKRRDTWASKEEAYKSFKSRKAWAGWDDRVLRIYVECGLRELPTGEYPDKEQKGVTLKCTRRQETASYRDTHGFSIIYRDFATYCKRVPIHSDTNDPSPTHPNSPSQVKQDVNDNAVGGVHNFASFSRVEGAGHLAPQTHPRGVAERIYEALTMTGHNRTRTPIQKGQVTAKL
ncbi:hypothetical protein D9758_005199 [Tetrapyrgos nigripes]|uniref:AB hydrolase-1 domain-containing protein n=1 Tax=Tetrapyrgos nigripes TaxID=182062 RepID=A0A8H5LWW5_9AGAR|nr:hypothetical protein D9758_005199 [Tetrapyrgos nigripes]